MEPWANASYFLGVNRGSNSVIPCTIGTIHFVSNVVSNAKIFVHSAANISGQKVLRFDEIWTSESGGEQDIWA